MINFPDSPTVGQTFTSGGTTWTWDGTKWKATPSSGGGGSVAVPGRNRIINGCFTIDQYNLRAGVYPVTNSFICDRWKYYATVGNKFNAIPLAWNYAGLPAGASGGMNITGYQGVTPVAGDYFYISQSMEFSAIADFQWGTAAASPATISFWAFSANAGTYSGSICNAAANRSYPFSFALAASTWTHVTVTVPGDTTGTWYSSYNTAAMLIRFDLGCGATYRGPANAWAGSNFIGVTGAIQPVIGGTGQLIITNIQLELGSTATPYQYRMFGEEFTLCQRYYERSYRLNQATGATSGGVGIVVRYQNLPAAAAINVSENIGFRVAKCAVPTVTTYSAATGAAGKIADVANGVDVNVTSINPVETGFNAMMPMGGASSNLNLQWAWVANAEI